jgi:hypothetical protein
VDELDYLSFSFEPESGFESVFSDPDRLCFPDKLTGHRASRPLSVSG